MASRRERVTIVTPNPAKAEALRLRGYEALVADVCDPATLRRLLPEAETALFAVGVRSPRAAAHDRRSLRTGSP